MRALILLGVIAAYVIVGYFTGRAAAKLLNTKSPGEPENPITVVVCFLGWPVFFFLMFLAGAGNLIVRICGLEEKKP